MNIYLGLMDPPRVIERQSFDESVSLVGQPVTHGRVLFTSHDAIVRHCVFQPREGFGLGFVDVRGVFVYHNFVRCAAVAFQFTA